MKAAEVQQMDVALSQDFGLPAFAIHHVTKKHLTSCLWSSIPSNTERNVPLPGVCAHPRAAAGSEQKPCSLKRAEGTTKLVALLGMSWQSGPRRGSRDPLGWGNLLTSSPASASVLKIGSKLEE